MVRACTELFYTEFIEGKCSLTIAKKALIKHVPVWLGSEDSEQPISPAELRDSLLWIGC